MDYVIRTWLEHKVHHTYPRPGGYDDQDDFLMQDWHTLNLYYSRAKVGIYSAVVLPVPRNAPDWKAGGMMDG